MVGKVYVVFIRIDGTWENNLFNFIRMVIPKLTRDLPHPFSMDGVVRKDDTLQAKAVREAVTNMVIHSDFMVNGVLKVVPIISYNNIVRSINNTVREKICHICQFLHNSLYISKIKAGR